MANRVDHDLMALVRDLFSEYDECEKPEVLGLEKGDDQVRVLKIRLYILQGKRQWFRPKRQEIFILHLHRHHNSSLNSSAENGQQREKIGP